MTPVPQKTFPQITHRIRNCWMGKSIGGTLGLPAEGLMDRLHFSFYDPLPTVAPPNDDLELQLVWLDLVENAAASLTSADFAKAWLDHIHYMWDEYGRLRWNLRRGVPEAALGTFENPFQSGMGSPIRSEIWACLFPGDPDSAAYYAAMDASLDHGTEGIAGEILFAVMQSAIIGGTDTQEAIFSALRYIPSESETARAVRFVLECHRNAVAEWDCREKLLAIHGHENFTHAPLNVALTIWALCYGEGDFEASILLAVNAGYDTDCTAATVGATLGLASGSEDLPSRWSNPIGEGIYVGPGIIGISAPQTIGELTGRLIALMGKLEPKIWDGSFWKKSPPFVDLEKLPGTISLLLSDRMKSAFWANGELPEEAKQAGRMHWTWQKPTDEPREIICLARKGARLFINDKLVIECPEALPYVPATHRSAEGSRIRIELAGGTHEIRLELNSKDPQQEASVILAYPNLHICPWTKEELPKIALLPAL